VFCVIVGREPFLWKKQGILLIRLKIISRLGDKREEELSSKWG